MIMSSLSSGFPDVEYYAPRFEVLANGRAVNSAILGDVLSLRVTLKKNGVANFDLTLSNREDVLGKSPQFKYSDSDTFNIGTELRIYMGYADKVIPLMNGQVNSLSPKFPESGTPTISVRGASSLFRLRGSKPQDGDKLIHKEVTDWEVAQIVAARNQIPIRVTREGPVRETIVQNRDQDDAAFLLHLSKQIEFDLFMQTDPNSELDTLHFVKPTDGRDAKAIQVFEFEWGKSLIEFSPKLSAAEQVSSVTVKGWNPRTKKPFEYTATERDLPKTEGRGATGPSAAKDVSPRGKAEVIVNASVLNQEEARSLAISKLASRAYLYKTGSGRVIGQPKMRPGDNVLLKGLGQRFSGMWHISLVDHSIGPSGYATSFQVERLKEKA